MPLDHYVPQVHLKNFCERTGSGYLHAIEKKSVHSFTSHTKDLCRIMDGNTNPYLKEQRAVEDFLNTIEPKYNFSVEKLRHGQIDFDCIYSIAGFISYVLTCSPCAIRTNSQWLARFVEREAIKADEDGLLPPRPSSLGNSSIAEMFNNGDLKVNIDGKYPQSLGIRGLLSHINSYGNYFWEILLNDSADSPFFTSDYPIAIEQTADPSILNRIIPLTPNVALRVRPDRVLSKRSDEISFTNFRYKISRPSKNEVQRLNRLIVQCAEQFVFYKYACPWIPQFVKKYGPYQLACLTAEIPAGTGFFSHTTLSIIKTS